jgi:PBP1b-binding outer membrane lipoprotein LpoB
MEKKLFSLTIFSALLFSCGSQPAPVENVAPAVATETIAQPTTEELNESLENSMQKVDSTAAALENALNDLN